MTPKSGQDSLARTTWKRLRFFIVLGVVLALHLPSFADSILRFMDRLTPVVLDEPAARIEAQALAKECRDGCSWEGKTVIVDGRAVKVSFDGWPMFVETEMREQREWTSRRKRAASRQGRPCPRTARKNSSRLKRLHPVGHPSGQQAGCR